MSRRRSTSPSCIMLFTRLMLPIDRSASPRCCFSTLISSETAPFSSRVFFQASGSLSVLENTNLGRALILTLSSSVADAENWASAT